MIGGSLAASPARVWSTQAFCQIYSLTEDCNLAKPLENPNLDLEIEQIPSWSILVHPLPQILIQNFVEMETVIKRKKPYIL